MGPAQDKFVFMRMNFAMFLLANQIRTDPDLSAYFKLPRILYEYLRYNPGAANAKMLKLRNRQI